jgi:purine-binding chemotaxis protein CheW
MAMSGVAAVSENGSAAAAAAQRENLAFRQGAEEYALDILKVQEIRNYEAPTAIANAPAFVKGVVDLRGVIVPVIDLRVMLRLPDAEYTPQTVVIILNLGDKTVGAVVDAVSDVVQLEAGQIRAAPELTRAVDTGYLVGLATIGDRMLILADIERLLAFGRETPEH